MQVVFNSKESDDLVTIAKYYEVTKRLLILGEQLDLESRTLPQVINELRNCLDHLMRVVQFKAGIRSSVQDNSLADYTEMNINKAYGHVYRAAYDALDWIAMIIKERVVYELRPFSVEAINTVWPEYYSQLRPRFEEIINRENILT